jgi:hypothetical protein
MRGYRILLALCLAMGASASVVGAEASEGLSIERHVIDSVVQVLGPPSGGGRLFGTGFLVARMLPGSTHRPEYFLVTNKHVVGVWNPAHPNVALYDSIDVRLYTKRHEDGPTQDVRVSLKEQNGVPRASTVAVHPNPVVDVAVVRLSDSIPANAALRMTGLDRSYLDAVRGELADIGSLVFALGYPRGITSTITNRPVAKAGHLAAIPGEELAFDTNWKTADGKQMQVTVRGKLLLVDGLIVPGNSGGPLLLPAGGTLGQDTAGTLQIRHRGNSRIVGIISSVLGPSGLANAYGTDYILETLALSPHSPSRQLVAPQSLQATPEKKRLQRPYVAASCWMSLRIPAAVTSAPAPGPVTTSGSVR